MEHFAIIDTATGRVVQTGTCQEGMAVNQWCHDGQVAIQTDLPLESRDNYFNSNGDLIVAPPQPAPWAVFDVEAEEWLDPRSEAECAKFLMEAKADAIDCINAWASTQRRKYITAGAGQEMVYQAKQAEAVRWLTDPAPELADFPLLAAEIGVTAPDAYQLAQLWANMSALWLGAAAAIEGVRLRAGAAVTAAGTPEGVDASLRAFWAQL